MRKVVLAMMTTLNGRLDDPGAWVADVGDDHYAEIDHAYEAFDSILVGSTTYSEMVAYWPGAMTNDEGWEGANAEINRSMAHKMHSYKKYVFTRAADPKPLEWNNAQTVVARSDDDIVDFIGDLKSQPGGDIHLAGGASLAQDFARLGLVDEYRFSIFPLVSPGARWFDKLQTTDTMELVSSAAYKSGVVLLHYRATPATP
jgi:dihydrofolate reductase